MSETGRRVVAIAGNIQRPSKTRSLVETAISRLAARESIASTLYDLVDLGDQLPANLDAASVGETARRALDDLTDCEALIVGTPVYKGSYAGMLKHFFDFVDPLAIVGKPVLLMATGGGYRHALIVEHQLRPLFGFFSANTVGHGIYASDVDFKDGQLADRQVRDRLEHSIDQLVGMLGTPRPAQPQMPRQAGQAI